MKDIVYLPKALKVMSRIPRNMSERIQVKVRAHASDARSQANNVKVMSDGLSIRLRVGDWRVIMRDHEVLEISEIGSRGNICESGMIWVK